MSEAQKIAGGSGSEQDIAEAKIELEVGLSYPPDSISESDNCLGTGEFASVLEIDFRACVLYK